MSTECSTSSLTLPPPAAAPPTPPTGSSGSSALPVGSGASRPSTTTTAEQPTRPRRRPRPRRDSQTLWFWLMAGPAILRFVLFSLRPMLASGYLSLTRYDVVSPPEFIGVD